MPQGEMSGPRLLNLPAKLFRVGEHGVGLCTSTIDVLVGHLGDGGYRQRNDDQSSDDPDRLFHRA